MVLLIVLSPYTSIIASIYMTYKVLNKRLIFIKNYWNMGLLLLFLWSLIVGVINNSLPSIISSFAIFVYFCVSVFIENYCNCKEKIEKLYKYLLYFSIFSAILGIVEKILSTYYKKNIIAKFLDLTSQLINNKRIYSTFGNPNIAGNWFAVMSIISIYFYFYDKNLNSHKMIYKISIILFLTALFLTGSRGAFIGLLFGILGFYTFKDNKNKKGKYLFFILFLGIVISTFVPLPFLNKVIAHNIKRSLNMRIDIWTGCINMFKDKPITGWGLMAVWDHGAQYIKEYYKSLFHAHNICITFMNTLGIIGFSIYLYIKINLFRSLKILYTRQCPFTPLFAGIQAVVIAHGFVDFTIIVPQAALLFISCSSIITSLEIEYRRVSVEKPIKDNKKLKSLFKVS